MILVDTSVWIDHINASDPVLVSLLAEERVLAHPYVIGEISLGSLRDRDLVLRVVHPIEQVVPAGPVDVHHSELCPIAAHQRIQSVQRLSSNGLPMRLDRHSDHADTISIRRPSPTMIRKPQ